MTARDLDRGDTPPLVAGTLLGPYRIEGIHGKGGMGEVYRARDTRLRRDVALKVLREDGPGNPSRLRRFEQEARAASALDHPAIVVVHDAGSAEAPGVAGAVRYIAMEFVDGRPLDVLLKRGPLTVRRCLDLATPLADGLARAHEAGIVHRDFKPSNIIVTPDDNPKILDFGLAKLAPFHAPASESDGTLTAEGTVLGTVGYMSPEQARGEAATAASDQFSFGCVVYEMLTGQRAFGRPSAAETIAAILSEDPPPLDERAPAAPAPLRWLVTRCLHKDPAERYVATRDLAREVRTLRDRVAELDGRLAREAAPARRAIGGVGIGLASVLLAVAGGVWLASRPTNSSSEPLVRPLTFRSGFVSRALFVPHSNAILYTASWGGQPLRTFQTLPEAVGFDRSLDAETQFPLAYSEDGAQVLTLLGVVRSATILRGTLAWWPSLGGRARPILEDAGWADWAPRTQRLAVVRDTGATRILELRDSGGGLVKSLFTTAGAITSVRFSPDEGRIAFGHHPSPWDPKGAVWTTRVDGSEVRGVTPDFEQCRGLDWNPATGELWFAGSRRSSLANAIWATDARAVLRHVMPLAHIFILHDVSTDGQRVLLEHDRREARLTVRRVGEEPRDLTWFGWSVPSDISPDGRSLLFNDRGAADSTAGVWLRPLDGGDAVRLGDGGPGGFSPDGRSVVTTVSEGSQSPHIVLMPVGAGERRKLTTPPGEISWPSFAGPTTLLFNRAEGVRSEVWRMETDGSDARALGADDCDFPAASPAGDRFACVGGEDRRRIEVYGMNGGAGRVLYERREAGRLNCVSWDSGGRRVFGTTTGRHLLTVDAKTGALLREELLPYTGASAYDSLIDIALSADASLQAYSITRQLSDLYEVSGLK